ncbi:MAG TPA: hypothetical protein VFV19_07135 [Candidatus Polarisedimenticolaceae bacterium]|nr:hypothetical protein [Candidatus Polarisedimenticolaceae bacterium]
MVILGDPARFVSFLVAALMLTLLAGLIWRQLARRKTPPRDPVRLHRWFRGYHYDWATGTVVDVSHISHRQRELAIVGNTGQGIALSRAYAGDVITVVEEVTLLFDGGQHDIRVSFTDDEHDATTLPVFQGCEGHRVTALWRRHKDAAHGEYVVFRDWTTGRNLDHPAASPYIHHSDAPIFSVVPVVVLGWIVGVWTNLPFAHGIVRDVLFAAAFGLLWFAIQFLIGTIDRGRSVEQLSRALHVIGARDAAPENPNAAP